MIPEIGILLGVYVIARSASPWSLRASRVLGVVAMLVALVVTIDLGLRGTGQRSITARVRGSSTQLLPPAATTSSPNATATKTLVTTTRADGGSIRTDLAYGIAVAKNSSLHREFVFIHDPTLPVVVDGTPGVTTVYKPAQFRGEYRYLTTLSFVPSQPLRAVQIKFLTFDVWGEHVRTLSYEEVGDISAAVAHRISGEWQLFSENDVEKHYATIGWVSRVRLEDGRIAKGDDAPVLAEAQKFSLKFKPEDLEPKPNPTKVAND